MTATQRRTRRWSDIHRSHVQQALAEAYVCRPGTVERYDAAEQRADVVPSLRARRQTRDGEEVVEPRLIQAVPVAFPQGGGYFISFPLAKGDPVLLVFADRSIDEWVQDGPGVVDVRSLGAHRQTDAIAIPGVRPFAAPLEDADDETMALGRDGERGAQIHITEDEVHLGGRNLTHAATRDDLLQQALTQLKNAIDSAAVAPMDGGATFKTNLMAALAAWPPGTAAGNVKVD